MKALNIAVVVMGVMIVVGVAVIGVTIAKRLGGASEPEPAIAMSLVPGAPLASFDPATVPLPSGARLQQIVPAGNRLVLHMAGEGGRDVLMVLDMAGGRVLGSFLLEPAQ
ncbi:MAG: hypothetical protein QUV20_07025 [Oceanibaculum nanhaiense]|uniref:hypothetical protein n=1 Tax=Oceanibaculum nanhaiense TaxID=1909734 RepID=UPI0025A3E85F|nr:hypothetical protein [Oceanibaculum nanhaiense]MDM7946071.1 hypothetical protein [Oceanibaculum nanhaiense]